MNFLVLESFKGHMFPNLKNMGTVMLEYLLKMLYSVDAKFIAIANQFHSPFEDLYFGVCLLIDGLLGLGVSELVEFVTEGGNKLLSVFLWSG